MPSARKDIILEKGEDFRLEFDVRDNTQTVTIAGTPTGGTFMLSRGNGTTGDLAYNASAAAVQQALEALPCIGSGNVSVTGPDGGPWVIVFTSNVGRLHSGMHELLRAVSAVEPAGTAVTVEYTLRDLTGYTALAQAWQDYEDVEQASASPLLTFDTLINSPVGRVIVTADEADVNAVEDCVGVWGLQVTSPAPASSPSMYLSGSATFKPRTVRP